MEELSRSDFWNCITVLLRNYHAVNKKIFACVISRIQRINGGVGNTENGFKDTNGEEIGENVLLESLKDASRGSVNAEGFAVYYKLLTKKENNIEAVSIVDFVNITYTCKFCCDNLDDFRVKLKDGKLLVDILTNRIEVERSRHWAEFVLKAKLLKWCSSAVPDGSNGKVLSSLRHVDVEEYNDLYKLLKEKHATQLLQFWEIVKESTDPLKFIYEDLALASYLICLWRRIGKPTAFADLGCGNGLLVYILNEESYKGYGYDVRARKLWSVYPGTVRLVEESIEPESFSLPADVDWLIGNHSDELSPWLPVLSATASFRMRFVLIPCCAFEFSGAKFQRRNSGLSTYKDFYNYAAAISRRCGYETLEDRLKIPSTKRLVLIGARRTYSQAEHDLRKDQIREFVLEERNKYPNKVHGNVKLRERQEAVRNCTQIDKNIIDGLVKKIFGILLASSEDKEQQAMEQWQVGGRLRLEDIAKRLSKEELKDIKSECGGIQTLMRNKHEIFEFHGRNLVGIRKPAVRPRVAGKPQTMKKRGCFFKANHPNGCPLQDAECTFIH